MKCYILRWNPERNTFKQKDFEEFQTDFNNGEEYSLRWEIEQWEEAEKGNLFILVQYNSENEGIALIGKFASNPYERINPKNSRTVHVADLEILSVIDRSPDSKILVTFQLEKEFPEINWHEGINGELIDNFLADKLTLRINDELQMRNIWDKWTFGEFMGISQFTRM
jgi:hypothetical protein